MSSDKDITLFDDIEWGNKTLPGLSDEKLLNTNWNKVTGIREGWKNNKTRKKKYSEMMKKVNAERMSDPVISKKIKNKISKANKGRKMSAESVQKMLDTKKRKGILHKPSWNKGISPSESTRKLLSEANLGKKMSKITIAKIQKNQPQNKAIITPEGEFCSISEAGRHYWDNKLTTRSSLASTRMWIREKVVNKSVTDFYFI